MCDRSVTPAPPLISHSQFQNWAVLKTSGFKTRATERAHRISGCLYIIHFGLFPQPCTPLCGSFLYSFMASPGYLFQCLGQLFTIWMACNMVDPVFLHKLDSHLTLMYSGH